MLYKTYKVSLPLFLIILYALTYGYAGGVAFADDCTPTIDTWTVASVEETTATLWGNITGDCGNVTARGFVWDTTSHALPGNTTAPGASAYASNWTEAGGPYLVGNFSHGLTGLTKGEIYYVRAYGNSTSSGHWGYGDEAKFLTKPDAPSSLMDTPTGNTTIDFTWSKGTGTGNTTIRYIVSPPASPDYPSNYTDGLSACYTASSSCQLSGLTPGSYCWFSSWSKIEKDGLIQYSDGTSQNLGPCYPGDPYNVSATCTSNTTIELTFHFGIGGNRTYIRAKQGSYPTGLGDGVQVYDDSGTSYTHSGLGMTQHWYYKAWTIDSEGGLFSQVGRELGEAIVTLYPNPTPPSTPTPQPLGPCSVITDTGEILIDTFDPGGNDSRILYGSKWFAQTFNTGYPYTLKKIRLPLYIQGNPGYVRVEIKECIDGNDTYGPADNFLTFGSLHPSYMTTDHDGSWTEFAMMPEVQLEGNTSYAITVQAEAGNYGNHVGWIYDSTGGYAGVGKQWYSINGGIDWGSFDADFAFQVYGEMGLVIRGAKVFKGLFDTDSTPDWLIVTQYNALVEPHYPVASPETHFRLTLNANNTILAESIIRSWGLKPGSIYLNGEVASTLEWRGDNYNLRLYETDLNGKCVTYTLDNLDWRGLNLFELDSWCLQTARFIGIEELEDPEYYISTEGNLLNPLGIAIFEKGIPGLGLIRGEYIYEIYSDSSLPNSDYTEDDITIDDDYVMVDVLGVDTTETLEDLGAPFGLGGDAIGILILLVFTGIIMIVVVPKGHTDAGFVLSSLLIIGFSLAGIINIIWLGIGAAILVLLFGKSFWLQKV